MYFPKSNLEKKFFKDGRTFTDEGALRVSIYWPCCHQVGTVRDHLDETYVPTHRRMPPSREANGHGPGATGRAWSPRTPPPQKTSQSMLTPKRKRHPVDSRDGACTLKCTAELSGSKKFSNSCKLNVHLNVLR